MMFFEETKTVNKNQNAAYGSSDAFSTRRLLRVVFVEDKDD